MSQLPAFNEEGMLPVGDHPLTLEQLAASPLVSGTDVGSATWDARWRGVLVDPLGVLVEQLRRVGVDRIFVDGSFVEAKDHPNDIDGYFLCERDELLSGRLQEQLNRLGPYRCWTWDPVHRRAYRGYPKKQLPMWHVYRVELYPHAPGLLSGLADESGNELEFPSAFRRSRNGMPRGIVRIGATP